LRYFLNRVFRFFCWASLDYNPMYTSCIAGMHHDTRLTGSDTTLQTFSPRLVLNQIDLLDLCLTSTKITDLSQHARSLYWIFYFIFMKVYVLFLYLCIQAQWLSYFLGR
jgi:hypothetical protein